MTESAVTLINLSTGYRSDRRVVTITSGINAKLRRGELTSLLGPNGAGKSTMLRTLSATLPPLDGNFTLMGRSATEYSPRGLAMTVGVVLTDRITADNLTVENLVELGRSPYTGFFGRLTADDRRIVKEAIELTGISELRQRPVSTLSDGERQKAMIAKVLAQQTPVIFLDEPTAFLDFPSKVELMLMLRELCHSQQKTVFLSTHDVDIALQTSDNLWLLDRQSGLVTGTPAELAADGSLARCFTGRGIRFNGSTGLFEITV